MDKEMVYYLGRLEYLEDTSRLVRTCFEKAFGHRVSQIGELIQDNLVYAQVNALILVPDSQHEFDLFELLSVDLAEKVVEAKNVAASEEAISAHDKEIILGVIEYLKNVHKRSDCFLMLLNHGDSEENVQKSEQACCRGANDNLIEDWIALMLEDKKTKKKTGKMALQDVEKTAP